MEKGPATRYAGSRITEAIRHSQLDRILEEFERCQRLTAQWGEPNCMSIEGPTGAGKTRLAEELVRLHPPYEAMEGVVWPVFHFQLPTETTPKRVAIALLESLGDPTPRRDDPTTRVIHLINAVVRDAIILDDFHHLLNLDTTRRRDAVSDLLKVMIKKTKKVFVISGIEGQVEEILRHNSQLSRLFASRMRLMPFPLDPNVTRSRYLVQVQEFDYFVQRAAVLVGVEFSPESRDGTFPRRMHDATNGVVGNILNLLRYAKDLADVNRSDQIDLAILAQAYDQRMKAHLDERNPKKNPFRVSH